MVPGCQQTQNLFEIITREGDAAGGGAVIVVGEVDEDGAAQAGNVRHALYRRAAPDPLS